MAINLTRGWSAASLVPNISTAPAANPAASTANPALWNSILASIVGAGGGSAGAPRTSTAAEDTAAAGYAQNLVTKGMVAAAPLSLYAQLFGKGVADTSGLIGRTSGLGSRALDALYFSGEAGPGYTPSASASIWGPSKLTPYESNLTRQFDLANSLLTGTNNALSSAATAAAGSPTYSPSVGFPQQPTQTLGGFNPYATSGWVSPFGQRSNPYSSNPLAYQMMSLGG